MFELDPQNLRPSEIYWQEKHNMLLDYWPIYILDLSI